MKTPMLRMALLALALAGLAACKPQPPPTDEPPQPQAVATAGATELRDAIKQPVDQAKAVEAASLEAADEQKAAVDEATQ